MPRTIEALARQVVENTARDHLEELSVVAHGFFHSDRARDRIVDSVVVGGGGTGPVGVDAVSGALIVQTTLVLLQAVATDTASDLIRSQTGKGWRWWRRRRAAQEQRRRGRGLPATTTVPEVPPGLARDLADVGRKIVIESGGSEETADLFAIAFATTICAKAREIGEP